VQLCITQLKILLHPQVFDINLVIGHYIF